MQSQQQISAIDFNKRVVRFEKIWVDTEGSDFDKTLAMLHAYCAYSNYGTHASAVWGKIKSYFTTMGYRQPVKNKDARAYTIQYLLFRFGEKFSFSDIKPHGDLAAIFAVIQANTNINPYDFDKNGEIFLNYNKCHTEIIKSAAKDSWKELCKSCSAPVVGMLLKAKIIDLIDCWEFIVERPVYTTYARMELISNYFDKYFNMGDWDIRELFNSKRAENKFEFLQYLYCKKNNFSLKGIEPNSAFSSEQHINASLNNLYHLARIYCKLMGKHFFVDYLLFDVIKKMFLMRENLVVDDMDENFYHLIVTLIVEREKLDNWNEIEEMLLNDKYINFSHLFNKAKSYCSESAMRYLLNCKKANIDIISLNTLNRLVARMQSENRPIYLCEIESIEVLIKHNADCISSYNENLFQVFNKHLICDDGVMDVKKTKEIIYKLYLFLIKNRHSIKNWDAIEKRLTYPDAGTDFTKLLFAAINENSLETIKYLLSNKNINMDLMSLCEGNEIAMTPLQWFICRPLLSAMWGLYDHVKHEFSSDQLRQFPGLIRDFVMYDPDSVRVNDSKGDNIFSYLNDILSFVKRHHKGSDDVPKIIKEIHDIIYYAYHRRIFTFFKGNYDAGSSHFLLPSDLTGLIFSQIENQAQLKKM